MKTALRLLFTWLAATHFANAQTCTNCRYLAPVFDSVLVTRDYHFGEGRNSNGQLQQLYLDVYEPYGDTLSARPVLMFAFGGGFVQGSKDEWYVVEICKQFARMGYVCAAMDYRVGINPLEIVFLQHMRIFFRPMQDMRASVQFMKAQFAELGNPHRIDTSRIVIGGASAGGITALMVAHCDKPSEMAEMGNLNVLDTLGGFYATSGFYPNYSWNSIGTVNISGALINANWIEPGDKPIISAHGNADVVVPYGYGPLGGASLAGFTLQGSYVVDSIANTKNVCSYLYTMEGQDHPNTGMGMPYIYSVVYRIAQRMYGIITDRSFCCPLQVEINPGDTLYTAPGMPDHTLEASLINTQGGAGLQWCAMACNFSSTASTVTFPVDTSLHFISLIATENNCMAADLFILLDSSYLYSSVANALNNEAIRVFPQPAGNHLNIQLPWNKDEALEVRILTLTGQVLHSENIQAAQGKASANLKVQGFATGNYILEIGTATSGRWYKQINIIK